jgi:HSP20 family protein
LSFWDEWFKRFGRRGSLFGDIDRFIEEMEKEMADAFKRLEGDMPDEMFKERRLPDGSIRREYGPFVYGYSVKIGPDGKPIIREFGNMKPGLGGEQGSQFNLQKRREPLIDVIEETDSIKILAELPGVDKDDIKLSATSDGMTINVDKPNRKYYKELEFQVEVDKSSAKSTYKNGVLETVFLKKKKDEKGTQINIE